MRTRATSVTSEGGRVPSVEGGDPQDDHDGQPGEQRDVEEHEAPARDVDHRADQCRAEEPAGAQPTVYRLVYMPVTCVDGARFHRTTAALIMNPAAPTAAAQKAMTVVVAVGMR